MANTNVLKEIEQYVREWCSRRYNIELEDHEKEVLLLTGGFHRFDIVSKDGLMVAGIKTSALRKNGKVSAGVIKSTFTELYFLNLVKATTKLMILTDKNYCDYFQRISKGKIANGIKIMHCPLPQEVQEKVDVVHSNCRKEIGKKETPI